LIYIRLTGTYLTPYLSPARIIGKKLERIMAGEGSLGEGGFAPSQIISPSQT
jgi:hypothetical protein